MSKDGEHLSLMYGECATVRSPFGGLNQHGKHDGAAAEACRRFDAGERGNPEAARLTAQFEAANPRIPMDRGGLGALIAADAPSGARGPHRTRDT